MPYGDPTDPRYTDYTLYFRDAVPDSGPEQRTYFQVTLDLASAPPADSEAAFQRLVDLVSSSSDFDSITARRAGEVTQTVTPTGTGGGA
jgi:hypothetical protein